MSAQRPQWHDDIVGELPPETAAVMIEMIGELLRDDVGAVLRQLTADLILDLRVIRNLTLQVQQNADPDTVLFNQAEAVTVEQHTRTMLEHIAETRQLAEMLKFYALALSER